MNTLEVSAKETTRVSYRVDVPSEITTVDAAVTYMNTHPEVKKYNVTREPIEEAILGQECFLTPAGFGLHVFVIYDNPSIRNHNNKFPLPVLEFIFPSEAITMNTNKLYGIVCGKMPIEIPTRVKHWYTEMNIKFKVDPKENHPVDEYAERIIELVSRISWCGLGDCTERSDYMLDRVGKHRNPTVTICKPVDITSTYQRDVAENLLINPYAITDLINKPFEIKLQ